jgi:hypothetical protein
MSDCWLQVALWGVLALQSITWLWTFIRMLRLPDEISSASTVIVTLRDLCHQKADLGGEDTKKSNCE